MIGPFGGFGRLYAILGALAAILGLGAWALHTHTERAKERAVAEVRLAQLRARMDTLQARERVLVAELALSSGRLEEALEKAERPRPPARVVYVRDTLPSGLAGADSTPFVPKASLDACLGDLSTLAWRAKDFKSKCDKRVDNLSTQVVTLEDALRQARTLGDTKPRRWWGLGGGVGYGAVLYFPKDSAGKREVKGQAGPGGWVGLTFSF